MCLFLRNELIVQLRADFVSERVFCLGILMLICSLVAAPGKREM